MKDRLISANALKELIANHIYPVADAFNNRDYGMFWTGGIEKAIDDAPAVDAVEVVRCKDCRWQNTPMCWITYRQLLDDYDFCCGGIRREDDYEEPEINPCRGCEDYDGKGGCKSQGGCGERREDETD